MTTCGAFHGVPYWLDRVPRRSRPLWPRVAAGETADLVVVGGGLAGAFVALLAAKAGRDVVLLEADRIGAGATAGGTGAARPAAAVRFSTLRDLHGLRVARALWDESRLATLELAALLRRMGARTDMVAAAAVELARTEEEEHDLAREHAALRDAGLEAAWLPRGRVSAELRADARCGLKLRDGVVIDPYRACLAVARAAARAGARLYERSAATRVRQTRAGVEVHAGSVVVPGSGVVIACGTPAGGPYRALARHVRPVTRFVSVLPPMTAAARRAFGTGVLGRHGRLAWHWTKDRRLVVCASGAGHAPRSGHDRVVLQGTGEALYDFSLVFPAMSGLQPDYRWGLVAGRTVDGVPLAGPHRAFPRHHFAFGCADSPAASLLAAKAVVRQLAGRPEPIDEILGFARVR